MMRSLTVAALMMRSLTVAALMMRSLTVAALIPLAQARASRNVHISNAQLSVRQIQFSSRDT